MYTRLICAICVIIIMVLLSLIVKKTKWHKRITMVMIVVYICGLVYYTMINGSRGSTTGIDFKFPLPFYRAIKSRHYGLSTNRSVLNCLLFIPFGFLFAQITELYQIDTSREHRSSFSAIIFCGLLASLTVEIIQLLFKRGVFEIDDLVKNTIGTSLGYIIWRVVKKV